MTAHFGSSWPNTSQRPGAEVGVPKQHAEDMGVSQAGPCGGRHPVPGAISAWLKFSRWVHQPVPSPPFCTSGSAHASQIGVQFSKSFGLKNQNQVLLTPKAFLFLDLFFFFRWQFSLFSGLWRIRLHSALHQILLLDP